MLFVAEAAQADPVSSDVEGARGLLVDIRRIVVAYEADWFVDRDTLREIHPTLLESVCRTSPEGRAEARRLLDEQLEGVGEPEVLYERAGRKRTAEVDHALRLHRQKLALEVAIDAAPRDCPFWVEAEPGFRGRQTDANRFFFSVETGGVVQSRQTDGTFTFGAGGAGRILPGYSWDRLSLLAGVEFGGGALFEPGSDPQQLRVNYLPAVPVVLRYRKTAWHYELESGPVALLQFGDTDISYGVRVGLGLGLWALNTRGILPWVGLIMAYEYYFEGGGRPAAHFFRSGIRVGFSWDP